jgi:hypothetical protein
VNNQRGWLEAAWLGVERSDSTPQPETAQARTVIVEPYTYGSSMPEMPSCETTTTTELPTPN